MNENVIYSINGPVVTVKDTNAFSMLEMVYVGNARLIGEVISIKKELTPIQVYETRTGLTPVLHTRTRSEEDLIVNCKMMD